MEDVLNPGATDPQREFYTRVLTSYKGGVIRRGAPKSKTVRALQLMLKDAGYDIAADGLFGRRTEEALKEWQSKNKLSMDGKAGRKTFEFIRETVTPMPRMKPTPVDPNAGVSGLPDPNVAANEGAMKAAEYSGDVGAAALSKAPQIMAKSYPRGAGGARPDPSMAGALGYAPGVNLLATPPPVEARGMGYAPGMVASAPVGPMPAQGMGYSPGFTEDSVTVDPQVTQAATQRRMADEEMIKDYLDMYADPRRTGSAPASPWTRAEEGLPYMGARVPQQYGPAPMPGNIGLARALIGR